MTNIERILELDQIERNIFRSAVAVSELKRTFGGQVAGQALIAAVRTVDPRFQVHSLHGYFLRPGNPFAPTVFLVDRIRDGRSFCTRRVDGIQNGETIFTMSASFHTGDLGIHHQDQMPQVPPPDDLPDPVFPLDRGNVWLPTQWSSWDVRLVPSDRIDAVPGTAARQRVWMRYRDELPADPVLHICTLAYLSDMNLLGVAKVPHPETPTQEASLDHAMWFLRPFRADDWLLYDQTSPSAGNGRALTQGRIYTRSGEMVAAVIQEGLTRQPLVSRKLDRPSAADPSNPPVATTALHTDTSTRTNS